MDLDLVVVYRAKNELMANSIRDLLLQNNIGSVIDNIRDSTGYYPYMRHPLGNDIGVWGEVVVERHQADAAVELISGFLAAGTELPPLSNAELETLALASGNPDEEP